LYSVAATVRDKYNTTANNISLRAYACYGEDLLPRSAASAFITPFNASGVILQFRTNNICAGQVYGIQKFLALLVGLPMA